MQAKQENCAATVEQVLITSELERRPKRAPNYEDESRALVSLAGTMSESPKQVFQKLADWALVLCNAGSAGISVWERGGDSEQQVFRWRATAGAYARYVGGTLPRNFSPCGAVLDRNESLLMAKPARTFPYITELCSPVCEVLLVPFYENEVAIGTVWVVAHDERRHFDSEDERLLASLTTFAGAAISGLNRIEAVERAERARREQEQDFRALVMATSDVVYRMNADWSEMKPLDGRGLIASVSEPIRGWMDKNLPAFEHARVKKAIAQSIHSRQAFELEHQVIRPDGSLAWTFSRAIPVLDTKNEIVEWLGAARDVTRRKEVEANLEDVTAEAERRKRLYDAALSTTPDLVYVFDLEHRFTFANEALLTLWGRSWDEAIGKTCLELGYEDWHAAMHDAEIEQVRATKRPIRGEVPFRGLNNGARRVYDYIFAPVFGTSGEVEAVAGITRDVTERQAMEQELRLSDRKKDDFIAMLAHELRNPLAPIRSGLEVLRRSDNPASRERWQLMMERQLSHMVRLVDDLLDVSRLSRNKMHLRQERVTLADVISAALETASPFIEAEQHVLTIRLPQEEIPLDADLTRLAQVFGNLLTNAAKYTPRGGNIWIEAVRQGEDVLVSLRDSGIGIPPESLPKIFDSFSQLDRTIERTTGGLGIGLALVKGLVELHGGRVSATSPGEDLGSTFSVTLPVAKVSVQSVTVAPVVVEASAGHRILVVDDSIDGAEAMAEMLGMLGHQVRVAHDGVEAVSTADAFRPEMVLMDIGMPRLNGLDATRQIREQPWGRDMVIVALSGWGQESDREHSREAGCNAHLVKPVELGAIRKLLGELST